MYRAKLVSIDNNKVTVAFIDFGNSDLVTEADIYELPPGLEMLAPSAQAKHSAGDGGDLDEVKLFI